MFIESGYYLTISSSVVPFSSCPQSFPASRSFSRVSFSHQVAKVLELQFQHQTFQWIFRVDFLLTGLISLQSRTLESLLQHNSSKASNLWCSAFFMVQLSHSYMITRKTTALTIWAFASKVRSLLYTMQLRFVRAFLLRSFNLKPSAVILEPKKIKSVSVSIFSPSICHEAVGPDAMILVF